ncbi:ATP-binding response regulator [Chitinophaga varians]|uniref:ATP-binding response regulator n=1 Tax=Chitinophaga varians TaxID=2202339 RepID=UPI00165FDA6A|nr:hybrid sensor histidine kinase/response regulator [Chitinophaga varians]MBC9910368.1 hybrid sensor histidine kinase/response regulator [Chitinophaga varians]
MGLAIVNTICALGTAASTDVKQRRSILIVNRMAVIPAILAFVLAPFLFYVSGISQMLYMPVAEGLLMLLIPLLNRQGYYFAAATGMVAIHCGSTFYFGSIMGELASVEFIAVYLFLMAFLIYKDSIKRIIMLSMIILTLVVLKLNYLFPFVKTLPFPKESILVARVAIQCAVVFLVGYTISFYVRIADERLSAEEGKLALQAKQIERLKETKTEILRNTKVAAHEIRNYLSNVTCFSEKFSRLGQRATSSVPVNKGEIYGMKVCGDVIKDIVDAMLCKDLSTPCIDRNTTSVFCWKDWAEDILCMYMLTAEGMKKTLFYKIAPSDFKIIRANRYLLTKVFSNSIINALKYCRKQVHVEVCLSNAHVLTLIVANDGAGLSAEVRKRIETGFAEDLAEVKGSNGFGIPTVISAVRQLGGKLSVDETKKWATVFKYQVPTELVEEAPETTFEDEVAEPTADQLQDLKILLVEDDFLSTSPFRSWARTRRFTLWLTDNPSEAKEIIQYERPDIVFLDAHIADISMEEMLRQIRTTDAAIPVVVISGDAAVAERARAKEADISAVLLKPFTENEFLKAIKPICPQETGI